MEFTATKDVLLKGLAKTQSIIEKKTTHPILSNVLLEVKSGIIEIVATDLEVGVKGRYEAEVKSEGSLTVSAKKFFEIVRAMPDGELHVKSLDNNRLQITGGKAEFKIVGLAAEDFPTFVEYPDEDFHKVPANILAESIEKVQHAISLDETRYYLNGVFFQTDTKDENKILRLVATDGHRLALSEQAIPDDCGLEMEKGRIVPRKGINELKKALSDFDGDAQICLKEKEMVVKDEKIVFVIRLIDDDFPDYSQVIPKNNDKVVTVARDSIFAALQRISLLSADLSRGVKFSLAPKELEISTSNPDIGEAKEPLDVNYDSEEMTIGFNAKYFLDILGVVREDDVVLELADELSPGLISVPNDPGFMAVIMPMRL